MPQFTLSLAQAHYREREISLQRRASGLIIVCLQSACKSPRKMVHVGAKCKGNIKCLQIPPISSGPKTLILSKRH